MDEKRMGEVNRLRGNLYESLSQEEFSVEALAKHLKPHYEEISVEELIEKLKALQAGMASGRKIFDSLYDTYVENCENIDVQKLVRERMDKELKEIPEEKQQDALCKMRECLCEGKVSDDASAMSLDELKDSVCEMICDRNRTKILKAMRDAKDAKQNAQSSAQSVEFKEYGEKFSEEERDLIDAAATYTIMRKDANVSEEDFGEQFAIQQSAMRCVIKNPVLNVVLKIISIVCFAASIFMLVHVLLAIFETGELLMLSGVWAAFFGIEYLIDPEAMIKFIQDFLSVPNEIYELLTEIPFIKKHLYGEEKQTMIAGSEEFAAVERNMCNEFDNHSNITRHERNITA